MFVWDDLLSGNLLHSAVRISYALALSRCHQTKHDMSRHTCAFASNCAQYISDVKHPPRESENTHTRAGIMHHTFQSPADKVRALN